jgi:hypothetical protein
MTDFKRALSLRMAFGQVPITGTSMDSNTWLVSMQVANRPKVPEDMCLIDFHKAEQRIPELGDLFVLEINATLPWECIAFQCPFAVSVTRLVLLSVQTQLDFFTWDLDVPFIMNDPVQNCFQLLLRSYTCHSLVVLALGASDFSRRYTG